MKKINIFLCLLSPLLFSVTAQTGPGGVGNSSDNILWLNTAGMSNSNNSSLTTWPDISGNNNNAVQTTNSRKPVFKTNQMNGNAAIEFDGANDYLELNNHITTAATSVFTVSSAYTPSILGVLNLEKHIIYATTAKMWTSYDAPTTYYSTNGALNQTNITQLHTGSAPTNTLLSFENSISSGTHLRNINRKAFLSKSFSTVGCLLQGSTTNTIRYLNGQIAEVIVFNRKVNKAERNIITSYLAGKYNIAGADQYYKHIASYGNDVFGIGQEIDGNHTFALSKGILSMDNASTLDNGDYLIVGNDNGSYATTPSVGTFYGAKRMQRTWRVDVTNTPGLVDITFDLSGGKQFTVDPAKYRLFVDSVDGSFGNSTISQTYSGGIYNAVTETVTFTGVRLGDNNWFTIGEVGPKIFAIANGDYNSTFTWSCGCIPSKSDIVEILSPFTVTINGASAYASDLTILSGAALEFTTSDSLILTGHLTVDGSFDAGTGSLNFLGNTFAQDIFNTSGNTISLYDLTIDNPNDVFLRSGNWELTHEMKIIQNVFSNTGGTFTFVSNAAATAQILPSTGSFDGDFIMQRYFSARNANYANIGPSADNVTVGDWDQEVYMSGVGGIDGNAVTGPGGGIFYSVYTFNNITKMYDTIKDTNTIIDARKGLYLFLGDNLVNFNEQTIDSRGTPFTGSTIFTAKPGFNQFANPYYSRVNYILASKPGLGNSFYILNQNTGSFDYYPFGNIPTSQGFWVYNPHATDRFINLDEVDKSPSNSSVVYKTAPERLFTLKLQSESTPYSHSATILANATASDDFDLEDAPYLESPQNNVPAIYMQVDGQELVQNAINSATAQQIIPISIKAGESGSFTISGNFIEELSSIYGSIILEDKISGKMIDLNEVQSYTFTSKEGTYDRFNLHLGKSKDAKNQLTIDNRISLVKRGELVEVNYSFDNATTLQIDVYNTNGQKVIPSQIQTVEGAGAIQLNHLNELNGVYMIVVRNNEEVITEKFKF